MNLKANNKRVKEDQYDYVIDLIVIFLVYV